MAIGNIKGHKSNSRKFTGGGPRPDRAKLKREEAKERLAVWTKFTPEQQLARLDSMFGKGKGAGRQRARLEKKLNMPSKADAVKTVTEGTQKPKRSAKNK